MGLNDSTIDMEFVKKIQSTSLIKFIAMTAPFTVVDKQMLLETFDLNELSKKLITLFDFYSRENNSDKEVN